MSTERPRKARHYQVAIVGGGVAGVTLALAFERLGIEYALFEAHGSLAPEEGASIGLCPNGIRILDQLGVLDEIEQQTIPLKRWRHYEGDGSLLSTVRVLSYFPSKLGYGLLILERQKLLQIMSDRLQPKGLIKTSSLIASIEEGEEFATVTTTHGFSVTADLVIGADGVRSRVRSFIDRSDPPAVLHSDEYMPARFACVFGVSSRTPGMTEGDCFSVYRENSAVLGFTSKDGIVFWFVFEDLGRTLPLSECPRYSAADVDVVCQSVTDLPTSPNAKFGDVYARRTSAVKTNLEEGIAKRWHTDRTVIVGDAAHKMVPNLAMGAMQAMESCVVLVNEVRKALDNKAEDGRLSREVLRAALSRYTERRIPRTSAIQSRAGAVCRALLRHDGQNAEAARVLRDLPNLSDADLLFKEFMGFSGAPSFDDIPLSARGTFFENALSTFQHALKTRENSPRPCSNEELFGLKEDDSAEVDSQRASAGDNLSPQSGKG